MLDLKRDSASVQAEKINVLREICTGISKQVYSVGQDIAKIDLWMGQTTDFNASA